MGVAAGRAGLWIRQVALAPVFRALEPLLFTSAALWRRLLFRITFIAITGSVGKTTAKEVLADILTARARTYRTFGNQNSGFVLALNVLRVAAMAGSARFRTCLAGTSPAFDLWADQVSSRWPDRLSFLAHCGSESCRIQTQQLGSHWVPAVTTALAVAKRLGIPLEESASVLRGFAPYTARLEPVALPCGAVMVRDDYSASIDTFEASLKFLREARAERRILVFTDISDSGDNRHSEAGYRPPSTGLRV